MGQRKISEEIRKYLNRMTFETLYINNIRDSSSNYMRWYYKSRKNRTDNPQNRQVYTGTWIITKVPLQSGRERAIFLITSSR